MSERTTGVQTHFHTLATVGAGLFAGVLLTIGVALGGYWRSLSADAFLESFTATLPYVARTIPLVLLPTLVGLAGSLWLSRRDRPAFVLWCWASACMVVLLVLTIVWFAPMNGRFVERAFPADQVENGLDAWLLLHSLRVVLAAATSVLGALASRQ